MPAAGRSVRYGRIVKHVRVSGVAEGRCWLSWSQREGGPRAMGSAGHGCVVRHVRAPRAAETGGQ